MTNNYLINEIKKIKEKHSSVLISVVGGGGKTTTILKLAHQLKKDASVLVTTTTAMFHPHDTVDQIYYKILPKEACKNNKVVALYDSYIKEKDKMTGINDQLVNQIKKQDNFDYIINEADGAKRKPLKCYAPHEPVIPSDSNIVIVVIGADAIGEILSENNVHRIESFAEVSKIKVGDVVSSDALINVITSPKGFLKGLPEEASSYILINKAISHPVYFDKDVFAKAIFEKTSCFKAVIFSEMIDFKLDSIYENTESKN